MVINRFNLLSSKEWLPFQKSWFRYTDYEAWLFENIRFFTKADDINVYSYLNIPKGEELLPGISRLTGLDIRNEFTEEKELQFALIDALNIAGEIKNLETVDSFLENIQEEALEIFGRLTHRKFLAIAVPNIFIEGQYFPLAWQLASALGRTYSLKDEKIACWSNDVKDQKGQAFFYVLYFRKDERSGEHQTTFFKNAFTKIGNEEALLPNSELPAWFILKPPPRKKDEILHPAKYPENLTEMFIESFSSENSVVFDPMTGTGSTMIAALQKGRKAYGIELSPFFKEIASERLKKNHFNPDDYQIEEGDAMNVAQFSFPKVDYMLTSPPYWDMLNMKGAEYQARRKEKGLQLNYSDHQSDIGNITDYQAFLESLKNIYFQIDEHLLKPGAYITIVVKNIKKKGSNYPFAWDLARLLSERWQLLPECFWCQDDISIAPYGYGNTWVSNTFHQYCLNFKKH